MGIETFAKVRCPWKTYSSAGECRWSIVLHDFTCMVLVKKKQKIHPPYVPYSRELKSTWPFTPSIGILGKYLTFQTRVCFFAASQFHHVSSKKPIKNRFRAPLSAPLRALSHRYLLDHLPQAPPVEEASCLQQQPQPKAQRKNLRAGAWWPRGVTARWHGYPSLVWARN